MEEAEAWAIAMTWQAQLQGKVRLLTDRDGLIRSIVECYAWVRLDEPQVLMGDERLYGSRRQQTVSIMRAVMVSWAALAACPEFSGSENSSFWKRVISELQQTQSSSSLRRFLWRSADRPEPVTDTHGFFNLPGHTFPRFLVEMPDTINPAFRELFTPDGPSLTPGVGEKLHSILERIRSYTSARTIPFPSIDICLSRRDLFFRDVEDQGLPSLVRNMSVPGTDSRSLLDGPRFRIRQMHIREKVFVGSDDDMNDVLEFMRQVPVPIGHIVFSPRLPGDLDSVSPADRATWLQAFLCPDQKTNRAEVTSLTFPRQYINDAVFQALMSALPFATTVHSLAFGAECMEREGMFEQTDLLWIAYAIFHPLTVSSSWRYLDLDRLTLTPYSTHVLTAMSRGNNLLALQNGTAPDCDAYYSAGISGGTLIQLEPSRESPVLLVVPQSGATVDVCGISSLDRAAWSEWVAVIVPAYGLGWVRPDELHDEQSLAPGKPSLRGLRLRREPNRGELAASDPPEVLLHILRPLGSALQYLNISFYQDISAGTLSEILHVCGSLKVLVVGHAGRLWSDHSTTEPHETQLEELELVVKPKHMCVATPTLDHITRSLRNLRALRIRVDGHTGDTLRASRPALEQLLVHASLLQYVHWRETFSRSVRYEARRAMTAVALAELRLTDAKYLFAQLPTSPASAIAFLSVVTSVCEEGGSALGSLVDRGVLTTIFQFATTPMTRSIHIEANEFG